MKPSPKPRVSAGDRCRVTRRPRRWVLFCLLFPWTLALRAQSPEEDRDQDGLTGAEERLLGTNPENRDTDGDGLLDGWEVNGYEFGGFVEPLRRYGANPLVKDVFVEIDWMASADGSEAQEAENALIVYRAALDCVRTFDRSGTGIRIHFDLGAGIESRLPAGTREAGGEAFAFVEQPDPAKILPYQDNFSGRPHPGGGSMNRLSLYQAYNDPRFFRPSRRGIFYYVVCAEQKRASRSEAGVDPLGEFHPFVDDFRDAAARRDGLRATGTHVGVFFRQPLPNYERNALVRYHYAVTLLHELGHAFGLGHGGALPGNRWDNNNFKVNYRSIMNYRFQFWGVDTQDGVPVMDFSNGQLVDVSELELFEPAGLGTPINDHVLRNLNVTHLPGTSFPLNIDWDGDGKISTDFVRSDLNLNGQIEPAVHRDHDDWGKLQRDGFDGIGQQAYNGCGIACTLDASVRQVAGDFNGDSITDLLLLRGGSAAWALGKVGGGFDVEPIDLDSPELESWQPGRRDQLLSGDFLDVGYDVLFWHNGSSLGAVAYAPDGMRLLALANAMVPAAGDGISPAGNGIPPADNGISPADNGGEQGWKIEPADSFFALPLVGGFDQVIVSRGIDLAVLTLSEAEELGRNRVVVAWKVSLGDVNRPLASLRLDKGREFPDGTKSLFVLGPLGLWEVHFFTDGFEDSGVPLRAPRVLRVDQNFFIPANEEDGNGWSLASDDIYVPADVDGDGMDELVLFQPGRIAVVRWSGNNARVALSTGAVLDGWSMDADWDRLYPGQFVPGGGVELLLSRGDAWLTLAWDAEASDLDVVAANVGGLEPEASSGAPDRLELRNDQALVPGRYLAVDQDSLLVRTADGLALVANDFDLEDLQPGVSGAGFQVVRRFRDRIGSWTFHPGDALQSIQADADPRPEFLLQKGELLAVADLSGSNTSELAFLGRVNDRAIRFDPVSVFRRGDVNADTEVDISDAARLLSHLFLGNAEIDCADAADSNDGGALDLADAIQILSFLFLRGLPPPAPGPSAPGIDPTPDDLGCDRGLF